MRRIFAVLLPIFLFMGGCATPPPQIPAYMFAMPSHQVDYLNEVQPLLVKRCVVCHSCYNSPCQLKLSSWDGLDRGASKEKIYNASRLKTMDPSRLFIDAQTTEQWRDKGFYSVTQAPENQYDQSILYTLLEHKRTSPAVSGSYFPEADDLTCAKDSQELETYLKKHPNRGMPFGFPPLKQEEFNIIAGWLMQGAQGPTAEQHKSLTAIPNEDQRMINQWEELFNNPDPKYRITSRYIYDHLFLAHVSFGTGTNQFYEIVRSKTPPGENIDIIATVRPYDDPQIDQFYYRFRKIYSTIVHKTHMVFPLDSQQYNRVEELFLKTDWPQSPHLVGYDAIKSANPFITYEQIPARSRYQWLLDNAHYIIMTFIRGPVCKGQVALNVINDHFWLMFLNPDHDLAVKYPGFLRLHFKNLRMPGERGSNYKIFKSLLENDHYKWAIDYYKARQQFYAAHYPDGLGPETIWPGNRPDDDPVLTVFRHFDSASVHRGVLGNLPKTMWVIDYPLLERIYYSLVAGFDVYGTAGHQLGTRLYMDALRIEGESYFLDYMPAEVREDMMSSWYIGVNKRSLHYTSAPIPAAVKYSTKEPQREFIESLVSNHFQAKNISFGQDYLPAGQDYPELPTEYRTLQDFVKGFVAVSAPGTSFFRHVADHNANVAWIRIRNIPGIKDQVISAVVDRWHDNVRFLFLEGNALNPAKDKVDFIPGFIGSYPNYFFVVDYQDLPDFFEILNDYDSSPEYISRLARYGVNRANPDFWDVYDWFQEAFTASDPERSGIVDLNRYYHAALEQQDAQ